MLITFIRHVTKEDEVYAKVLSNNEGAVVTLGILKFPNKAIWSKFYGTIQSGSLAVRDLEVRMETTNEPLLERIKDDSNSRTDA